VSNLISDEIIEKRLFAGRYVKRYRVITYKSKLGIMSKWIGFEEEENE